MHETTWYEALVLLVIVVVVMIAILDQDNGMSDANWG